MKICPFCAQSPVIRNLYLHGDNIRLHVYFSNAHIQHTYTKSNTNISTTLRHLGALFSHAPYPHNLGVDPFRTFLFTLFHQYNDNTRCASHSQSPTPTVNRISIRPLTHVTITVSPPTSPTGKNYNRTWHTHAPTIVHTCIAWSQHSPIEL